MNAAGRLREMSLRRFAARWLASGKTRSWKKKSATVTTAAAATTGTTSVAMPRPEALIAVISLSPAMRPKVMSVEERTAIGMPSANIHPSCMRNTSSTTMGSMFLDTILSNIIIACCMMNRKTMMLKEAKNGKMCSFMMYLYNSISGRLDFLFRVSV